MKKTGIYSIIITIFVLFLSIKMYTTNYKLQTILEENIHLRINISKKKAIITKMEENLAFFKDKFVAVQQNNHKIYEHVDNIKTIIVEDK